MGAFLLGQRNLSLPRTRFSLTQLNLNHRHDSLLRPCSRPFSCSFLAVEEENFAVGWAQLGAKSSCELYGGESSTDDDHSNWLHFFAPSAALNGDAAFLAKEKRNL